MQFFRLTPAFYERYSQHEEILKKGARPYYVLLLQADDLTYAIPLRSHISHPYCFLANVTDTMKSGLDYSKAVVIADKDTYIEIKPVTIRQNEFAVFKKHEFVIQAQFSAYVQSYKKEVLRRLADPNLPASNLCAFSALKYFHQELGLE